MPRFKNVSPLGDLDVPALGAVVEHGEIIDVAADLAPYVAGLSEHLSATDTAGKEAALAAQDALDAVSADLNQHIGRDEDLLVEQDGEAQ